MSDRKISRRAMLGGAAAAAGGAVLGTLAPAQQPAPNAPPATPPAAPPATPPVAPPDPTRVPGPPSEALGGRSPFEAPSLAPTGVSTGAANTPLQALSGTITPSDLHFQRHHAGIAVIDPARWELMVHGLVDRPTVFTLADLKRLPSTTRTCFVECAGNGRVAYRTPKRELTPQDTDGMSSNSEWTGVLASVLLREVGVRSGAAWVLAEGGDASVLTRSIPLEKMQGDALVAYAQNGEPLRMANGYPVRLVLPGFEGNMQIKWLRRLEVNAAPSMARNETSKYTDPLPNGTARQFSFVMDAKSVITSPAHPERLAGAGWHQVTGLAWSGRGRITRVDVSADGGRTWTAATLQDPALPAAYTRFSHMWRWDGRPARLMSRATDETGAVQPTLAEFRRVRGPGTDYHFNHIRGWDVDADGRVVYAVE
jgi:sulfane dehydrogenase subunit SoxC